jgi:hypothetical protein
MITDSKSNICCNLIYTPSATRSLCGICHNDFTVQPFFKHLNLPMMIIPHSLSCIPVAERSKLIKDRRPIPQSNIFVKYCTHTICFLHHLNVVQPNKFENNYHNIIDFVHTSNIYPPHTFQYIFLMLFLMLDHDRNL